MPSAARSAASSEVSTVTASTLVAPAPATAASSILRPPRACTVRSSTPIFDGHLGGAAHRLGDVVELEVEKDALVALVQRVDELAPLGDVELEPDLVALDGVAERVDLLERGARVRMVERHDEPVPLRRTRRLHRAHARAPRSSTIVCFGTMVASFSPRRFHSTAPSARPRLPTVTRVGDADEVGVLELGARRARRGRRTARTRPCASQLGVERRRRRRGSRARRRARRRTRRTARARAARRCRRRRGAAATQAATSASSDRRAPAALVSATTEAARGAVAPAAAAAAAVAGERAAQIAGDARRARRARG